MIQIPASAPSFLRDFAAEVRVTLSGMSGRIGAAETALKRIERLKQLVPTDYAHAVEVLGTDTDITLDQGYMNKVVFMNVTVDSDITLMPARHGGWIALYNAGAGTATILDGATTLCTLPTDEFTWINCGIELA